MRYVALLRGINVGGNNIIPMEAAVKKSHACAAKVLVRSDAEMKKVVAGIPRTTMAKLSTLPSYQHVTVRNLNTTRKLAELLEANS